MSEIEAEYKKLTEDWAVLPDLGIGLVELTGDDAAEWLQGQATNDLRVLGGSEPISFCLCEPTGQLLAVCDVWRHGEKLLVATDNVAALLHRAETMVIMEDVQARHLGDYELTCVAGQISDPDSQLKNFFCSGLIMVKSNRLNLDAWDLWTPKRVLPLPRISVQAYEIARIEGGSPKRGVDYTAKTLPPELGPAFEAKHVSYRKGCYTGQEVLMRIHSRGHTNKTWMGILLDAPVEVGAQVRHESREDAGVITSVAVSPNLGPIAAATLRNEAAQDGAEVTVGDVRGVVRQMPLRP